MITDVKNAAFLGVIRHLVTSSGTLLLGQGVLSEQSINVITGAIVTIAGLIWSIYDKKNMATAVGGLTEQVAVKPSLPPVSVAIQADDPTPKPAIFDKGHILSDRSKKNLKGVHPILCEIIESAIATAPYDFTVVEGLRSLERQKSLFNSRPRRTWTMNSKHLAQDDGFAHAVDLYIFNSKAIDEDLSHYAALNAHIQEVANAKGVFNIEWGGEWKVRDGFHWQIN